MSSLPLSAAQRAAVEHPYGDACVTAGAGSGKTRVLTARFAHLVRAHHLSVRGVAALTFTDKAAAQLRERVARLFDGPDEEQARADVEFAPILTLHAFFAQLLRLHAIEAGLDPAFAMLDEREAALLRADALTLAEQRLLEQEPETLDALRLLAGTRASTLDSLYLQLRGSAVSPGELVFVRGAGDLADLLAGAQSDMLELAAQADGLDKVQQQLLGEAQGLCGEALRAVGVLLAGAPGDVGEAGQPLRRAAGLVARLTFSRKAAWTGPRKRLQDALESAAALCLDEWIDRHLRAPIVRYLGVLDEVYAQLKREQGALDFSDLEIQALGLLTECQARGELPDLLPQALLVDEYQDTNALQARILGILRRQSPHFSVGDPKQSIYRFRRADVGVILAERGRVGAGGCHAMNESYRAHPRLISAINGVSAWLFADGRGGVPYEALEAMGDFAPSLEPLFEFALVDGGPTSPLPRVRIEEAEWIAQRIVALTDGGTPCAERARNGQALRPGDVAILVRARASLPVIEAALARNGLPFLTHGGTGFFGAQEIEDLLHALRVLHDPLDRFALAALLAGPLFAADEAQLARWFDRAERRPALERVEADAAHDPRLARLLAELRRLRGEAVLGSPVRAVRGVLEDLGLMEAVLMLPQGEHRAANLRKALGVAAALEAAGRRGLGELVRQVDALRQEQAREVQAPAGGEQSDVVQLLTVHAAKGLEYPVVFLADAGRRPGANRSSLCHDGRGGVSLCARDPVEGSRLVPAGFERLRASEQQAADEESQRLLYVAMTRAKERLIVSASCRGFTKVGQPYYAEGWARDLWDLLQLEPKGTDQVVELQGGGQIRCTRLAPACVPRPTPALPPDSGEPSPAACARADELVRAAARDSAPLGQTRFVVSVSELLLFAQSPARYYEERVLHVGRAGSASVPLWRPAGEPESEVDLVSEDPHAERRERRSEWDEAALDGGLMTRAALGRAVHALIEHIGAEGRAPGDAQVQAALRAELDGGEPTAAECAQASDLVARFLGTRTCALLRERLALAEDVERELAFHAAVRFPEGARVGGLEALLVKGSIDLWLPQPEGLWLVDHKTNRRTERLGSPEALAEHYRWQLALYALAAERIQGVDVAGARLLLLDRSWGAQAVEVDVDVSGETLAEARRLCQAFALAEMQGRYPQQWRTLLA